MVLLSTTAPQVLCKQPADTALYSMDFSNLLSTDETISSVATPTSDPVGLTITDAIIVGGVITMKIAGGTDKINYRVEVVITTSLGNILEGDGPLKVRDN